MINICVPLGLILLHMYLSLQKVFLLVAKELVFGCSPLQSQESLFSYSSNLKLQSHFCIFAEIQGEDPLTFKLSLLCNLSLLTLINPSE